MAAERLSIRTIKEVLRLKWEKKFSTKQIAQSCNIARSTIRDYLERARRAGLSWPLAPDLDENATTTAKYIRSLGLEGARSALEALSQPKGNILFFKPGADGGSLLGKEKAVSGAVNF